jgi:hypothetical protein
VELVDDRQEAEVSRDAEECAALQAHAEEESPGPADQESVSSLKDVGLGE